MTMELAPVHQLELIPLGDGAWRLCDSAAPAGDEAMLIAYVEQMPNGAFEAVWVYPAPGVDVLDSVEHVLLAGARRLATMLVTTDSKPIPIPHRPPFSAR